MTCYHIFAHEPRNSSDPQEVQLELARLGEARGANQGASPSDAAAAGAEVDGAALPGELAGGHQVRVQPRDVPHVVQGDALREHRPAPADSQRHRLSVGQVDEDALVAVGQQQALVARHGAARHTRRARSPDEDCVWSVCLRGRPHHLLQGQLIHCSYIASR